MSYRGSAEKWQIHTQSSHFLRLAVTVDFDDISLLKDGQYIIQSLSLSSVEFHIGGLRKCPKFGCRGHTFGR